MEKKDLKRLALKKEEIINLNDYEMTDIKGGDCGTWTITTSSIKCLEAIGTIMTIATEIWGDDCDCDCGGHVYECEVSEFNNEDGCLLSGVEIYG